MKLFTQSYFSIFNIDEEFVPSLHHLLSAYIPSLHYFEYLEKLASKNQYFYYLLFFTPKKNEPVGFCLIQKTNVTHKTGLLRKSVTTQHYSYAYLPSSSQYTVAHPAYEADVERALNHYVSTELEINENEIRRTPDNFDYTFVRKQREYRDFHQTLCSETKSLLKKELKKYNFQNLEIENYQSLKEIFTYRNQSKLYRQIKKLPCYQLIEKEDNHFFALYEKNELKLLWAYSQGEKKRVFLSELYSSQDYSDLFKINFYLLEFFSQDQNYLNFYHHHLSVDSFQLLERKSETARPVQSEFQYRL